MTMLKLLGHIPYRPFIACSGGIDSMAVLQFLLNGKRTPTVLYFNHQTKHGNEAQEFITDFCLSKKINFHIGTITRDKRKNESLEEYWRNERYNFLNNFPEFITCHHLDDAVETWLFGSFNGQPKLIPYKSGKAYRPFLLNKKEQLSKWATMYKVPYIQDMSNFEDCHARNRIRNNILPQIKLINPGIHTVIRKKLEDKYKDSL